jgi:hypothetical protein
MQLLAADRFASPPIQPTHPRTPLTTHPTNHPPTPTHAAAYVATTQGIQRERFLLAPADEEAARYPALFRHRLPAERPDWREHARPLPPPRDRRLALEGGAPGGRGKAAPAVLPAAAG